jgi:hypothetical protein
MKKYIVMAALITLPSLCLAAGPGAGSLTKQNVRIGNCTANSITVKWNLDSLMGEPTVNGAFQWSGINTCSLPSSTKIWLRVQSGQAWGYVDIDPTAPNANSGFGFNATGSPNWGKTICAFSGRDETECLDPSNAKALWKNGRVVDFEVVW